MPVVYRDSIRVPVRALEEIGRIRGGSQPHLMRCADGNYYVVKFPNNPQGSRILANELLGCRLASLLRLPVAAGRPIFVDETLIQYSGKEMYIESRRDKVPCQWGFCFGSLPPRLKVSFVTGGEWAELPEWVGTKLNLKIHQAADSVVIHTSPWTADVKNP